MRSRPDNKDKPTAERASNHPAGERAAVFVHVFVFVVSCGRLRIGLKLGEHFACHIFII
mgnify:CR=1 FL=1